MKKILIVAAFFCLAQNIFCAPKHFSDLDLVRLDPAQSDAEFDTFIIGENAQSYTARRFVAPFYMNAYETTYNLWYIVRVYAE
ncbi:MAG: formylglycine-generating enzyme family protein, partial [Treponemataceae bacterium]|nr:formylglycine-generating enzyme family protein [Treponemataceae bacterium]